MMLAQLVADVLADAYVRPTDPAGYYRFLHILVKRMQPKNVLELGTGTGLSAAYMMVSLPEVGRLTTINWPNPPSGDDVGRELKPFKTDPRLTQILGDSRKVRSQVKAGVDLLFIDSGTEHTYSLIAAEWELYESALADRAIVCCDDIRVNDMPRFWDALPYEKIELKISPFGFGVFEYERNRR